MRARLAVTLAAAALAMAPSACGEVRPDATARTSPVPVSEPRTAIGRVVAVADVSLVEFRLQPARTRVARAGVIAFVATNDGQLRHALEVDGPAGAKRSVALRPGERTTLEVRLPRGTYKWLCPLADHEQRGMSGRVRVAE